MEFQFSVERSKVKVTDHQKPKEIAAYMAYVCLWAADQAPAVQTPTANWDNRCST